MKENAFDVISSHKLRDLPKGDYFVTPIPHYIAQFASRDLVSDILDKQIEAEDDPLWKSFGFETPKEYAYWSQRLCGLICVKMVLDALSNISVTETVASLTKEAVNLGGYEVCDTSGKPVEKGWFYAPLIDLIKQYGLNGEVCVSLSTRDLCLNIINNYFSIASVNPKVIRNDLEICPEGKKGGHLVLVLGFKWDGTQCLGFYIHNPSGRVVSTQENAFISIERFEEAFANRGLVLKGENDE